MQDKKEILKNYLIYCLNNVDIEDENEIKSDCIYCGKSKSGRPHLHINLEKNVFHCFRCDASGNLFKFIFDLYRLDYLDKKQYLEVKNILKENNNNILINNKSLKFNEDLEEKFILNITNQYNNIENLKENTYHYNLVNNFLIKRLKISLKEILNKNLYKKIKLDYNPKHKFLYFYSFRNYFKIGYLLNPGGYKKYKILTYKNIKKPIIGDYYFIEEYNSKNLVITEGIIDLITLYLYYFPFKNKTDFLSLSGKFFKIDNFIRSLGKYYENIYIIKDLDTPDLFYIERFKNKNKLDFYSGNIYLLEPEKIENINDVNDLFLKQNKIKLNIKLKI